MRTRTIHLLDESTVLALSERKNGSTFRALAECLGYPASMAATAA